jgi:hypothetical protein
VLTRRRAQRPSSPNQPTEDARSLLAARGPTIVDKLPPINPTFPLFSAKYLVKAQNGYRILNDLKIALPIAALLLFAAGVYVAKNHRRALVGAGLGLATSMFVLAALLLIFRGIYINSVPSSKVPADASQRCSTPSCGSSAKASARCSYWGW